MRADPSAFIKPVTVHAAFLGATSQRWDVALSHSSVALRCLSHCTSAQTPLYKPRKSTQAPPYSCLHLNTAVTTLCRVGPIISVGLLAFLQGSDYGIILSALTGASHL